MRLIDADALLEQMKRRKDYVGRPSDPVCLVEDAPTIGCWISTSDRMPKKDKKEEDKDVLVWLYDDYYIGRYNQDPDNLQMRWCFEDFNLYGDDMFDITHWMPLPEPPEKKEGKE